MRFNLADYETVEERIRRFYGEYPNGRIITEDYSTESDRSTGIWRVKASVYIDAEFKLPKATGHAFERDGSAGANQTSALENCETSAIGRALANMNMSGNKRATREEMAKVARGEATTEIDWAARYGHVSTVEQARELYTEALAAGAPESVLKSIETLGLKLGKK